MGKDKVMCPTNMSRGGNIAKPSNTGKFKGSSPSMNNLTPYNREGKKGK